MNNQRLIYAMLLCTITIIVIAIYSISQNSIDNKIIYMRSELESVKSELVAAEELLDLLEEYQRILIDVQAENDRLREALNKLGIDVFEVTGYAPLDNRSGICNDGNPWSTATGTLPTAGRTIAVDPNVIPYGAQVWIEGYGWRTAEDTGGAIKGNKLDIMVDTYAEAIQIGRKERVVVYSINDGS